eukprot:CAMPEP_0171837064 /NCGR_PEP_ID=MMETSP0992-20121227/11953_1 /TAXON_ID=483369 /ORGANISM="non described non described, Strain CCMP2098" /LENGTH=232 /DNA_ID=CAMNT_0012453201 /DNA_START=1324 /DNA_END=2025 /DNA_ORIENTATION=-
MVNWDEGNGSSRRTPSHQEIADVSIAIKSADIEKSDAVNLAAGNLDDEKSSATPSEQQKPEMNPLLALGAFALDLKLWMEAFYERSLRHTCEVASVKEIRCHFPVATASRAHPVTHPHVLAIHTLVAMPHHSFARVVGHIRLLVARLKHCDGVTSGVWNEVATSSPLDGEHGHFSEKESALTLKHRVGQVLRALAAPVRLEDDDGGGARDHRPSEQLTASAHARVLKTVSVL